MGRPLRFVPPGALIEVTCTTLQRRFLLRPSRDLTEITLGIISRAARLYDVGVCAFVFLSNHAHLLLRPRDAEQLARFMGYLNGNLAKEAGRLHGWREKFWGRRYSAIPVSDEEAAQVARLRYLLEQGCKEGLIRSPREWPGASAVHALLSGSPIDGLWFDRTQELNARRRGKRPGKHEFASPEKLRLVALPCWEDRPAAALRSVIAEMIREIERETKARTANLGAGMVGPKGILTQDPHASPAVPARRPAPRFHAATRRSREALERAFREFVLAFRRAAESMRAGARSPAFPQGCFPPGLPFVRSAPT